MYENIFKTIKTENLEVYENRLMNHIDRVGMSTEHPMDLSLTKDNFEEINIKLNEEPKRDSFKKLASKIPEKNNQKSYIYYKINTIKNIVRMDRAINVLVGLFSLFIVFSIVNTTFGSFLTKKNSTISIGLSFITGLSFILASFYTYRASVAELCIKNFCYKNGKNTISVGLMVINLLVQLTSFLKHDISYDKFNGYLTADFSKYVSFVLSNIDYLKLIAFVTGVIMFIVINAYIDRVINYIGIIANNLELYVENESKTSEGTEIQTKVVELDDWTKRGVFRRARNLNK